MNTPTCAEIWDGLDEGEFVSIKRDADDSWRHGAYITQVIQRPSDGTYWNVNYCLSTDGETNELREGTAQISQVFPHEVTRTVYK